MEKERRENLIKYRGELEKDLENYSFVNSYLKEKKYKKIAKTVKKAHYDFKNAGLFDLESITGDFIDLLQKENPDESLIKKYNNDMIKELEGLKKKLNSSKNVSGGAHDNVYSLNDFRHTAQKKPF